MCPRRTLVGVFDQQPRGGGRAGDQRETQEKQREAVHRRVAFGDEHDDRPVPQVDAVRDTADDAERGAIEQTCDGSILRHGNDHDGRDERERGEAPAVQHTWGVQEQERVDHQDEGALVYLRAASTASAPIRNAWARVSVP